MIEGITLQDYERAEADIRAKQGRMSFYVHAAIYVLVNILLLVLNLVPIASTLSLRQLRTERRNFVGTRWAQLRASVVPQTWFDDARVELKKVAALRHELA